MDLFLAYIKENRLKQKRKMEKEMKTTRKKTTITEEIVQQAALLASKGYGISMIAGALDIGVSTCRDNPSLRVAIKRGQAEARQKVIDDLMARSENDQSAASSIFLAKQLKVFDDPFITATPKSVKEAVDRIGNIYESVATGELDQDKGDRLVSYLEKLIKGYEIADLEERIKILEEKADGK